ncbi:MAG: thiamine pyrophosphate-binding protein [Chloroflexota bacterium]|nr:MAG: thiamine pyrophosphate-binding protein [Chloroflexota bacterium]
MRMTGGQALVAALESEAVKITFGLPGIQLDWAFDALHAARERVRVVHTRHEQAAAYMADGFARTTGQPGVFIVVPGPGVLNTLSALATAYACNSPVLCITGQINSDLIGIGRGVLHEVDDQLGILRHVTKWAGRALTPRDVPILVHEAFRQMRSGRPRPVEIEIPPDVLQAVDDVDIGTPLPATKSAGNPDDLLRAARSLGGAERPLILAGGGVIAAGAWDEVRALSEMLEAPVVMSDNGRGIVSDRDYHAHLQLALPELLPPSDAILAVGTRMVDFSRQPIAIAPSQTLIRIDADATQLSRGPRAAISIAADARAALTTLVNNVSAHNRRRPSRQAELDALKRSIRAEIDDAQPQAGFGHALRNSLPDDTIVVSESTQVGYWATFGLPIYEPRTYLTAGYQGTLGYGYPTALGAQVGNPSRRVVSINGDGGFMFNVQELATAAQHRIPVTTIVFDDGAFGNVRRIQEHSFGGRVIASDLRNPPFARLAEMFGVQGIRAEGADGLAGAMRDALAHDGPTLIEVPVGPMPMFLRLVRERLANKLATAR